MNELPTSCDTGADQSCPVNFLVLFDTEPAGRRAFALLQKVLNCFESGFRHNVRIWQDTRLEDSSSWENILTDLRSANILVIAADRNPDLLAAIVGAPDATASRGALVALVDDTKNQSAGHALERFAHDRGLQWTEWDNTQKR